MAIAILPARFVIASTSTHICVSASAVIPKPNFINLILAILLIWTMVALTVTGLGSLVSIFFISLSLGCNLLALEKAIGESRGNYDYSRGPTH